VEFAKRAGIAIYARASFSDGRETVVRRDAPHEHHGVRAVVSERDVAWVGLRGAAVTERFRDILAAAEQNLVPIKELRFQHDPVNPSWARGSFVVSTSTLPDWGRARESFQAAGGSDLEIRDGLGALSLIGVGLNRDTVNVAESYALMRELAAPVLGLSTSRFRISFITEAASLDRTVDRLHARFIVEGGPPSAPGEE